VSSGTEPEAQLRLFPSDGPRRRRGQPRVVPTYSDEQRAAFRQTEEVIARIRPASLPDNRKLCPGCGRIIHRDRRSCGRRWCPVVHRTWLADREAVIRRALQTHGGPFLVIAITQTHEGGWWDCDGSGHPGRPCSGAYGCRVKPEIAKRENDRFPERRRALLNHARTWALRGMKRAGYDVEPSACILVQTIEPQSRGLDHGHLVLGHAKRLRRRSLVSLWMGSLASPRSMASASSTDTTTRFGGSVSTRDRGRPSARLGTYRSTSARSGRRIGSGRR
jgi:hypothetical protein